MTNSLIPFSQAATQVPGRVSLSTLHRWRLKGVRGVRLETLLVGGRRFVSQESLEHFFAATTAAAEGGAAPGRTRQQQRRSLESAERTLREAGI